MFTRSARYYDAIYSSKDYAAESRAIAGIVRARLGAGALTLLDVACGTGLHLEHLRSEFSVHGLDLDAGLLTVARERMLDVPLHQADMIDFDIQRHFDVVTCLFSSIGYARTLEAMGQAIACMARHLKPGGLLIVEPWFTKEEWRPGTSHLRVSDEPDLKVARMNFSSVEGRISVVHFHYLVGTAEGIEHFEERHELGLFSVGEMSAAFASAGLLAQFDPKGIAGRGLYVAQAPGPTKSA